MNPLLLLGGLAALSGCHGGRAQASVQPGPSAAPVRAASHLIPEQRAREIADSGAPREFVVRADFEQRARLRGEVWIVYYVMRSKDPNYFIIGGGMEIHIDGHTGRIISMDRTQ